MKSTRYALLVALGLIALAAPNALRADSIFSNLGPGGTYNGGSGFGAGNPNPIAMAFTVAAGTGFALTQIDLALYSIDLVSGGGIELVTNSASGVPSGDVLGSWTFPSLPTQGSNSILQTVSGISGIVLTGGTTYWLETTSAPLLVLAGPQTPRLILGHSLLV